MVIRGDNAQDLYLKAYEKLMNAGEPASPRGLPILELIGVQLRLDEPEYALPNGIGRSLVTKIGLAEACQLVGGFSDAERMVKIAPAFVGFLNDQGYFDGAYGPRVREQLVNVIQRLERDPDTRQAMVQIWSPDDLARPESKDYPCTVGFQFLIRFGKLDMIASMRSNDFWRGLPYDLVQFTMLQRVIAWALRIPTGRYIHNVGSFHLYESDEDAAAGLHDPDEEPTFIPHFGELLWPGAGPSLVRLEQAQRVARDCFYGRMHAEAWEKLVLA